MKTCIITGATDGIGKEAAFRLGEMGFQLGLVGRNPDKINATRKQFQLQQPNTPVDFFQADLSIMSEVRKLAGELLSRYKMIDVLLSNAGGYFADRTLTDEGLESSFALNHLSYFLLTDLLLEKISAAPASRIINVASDAHFNHAIEWDNMQGEKNYRGWNAYAQSKLCNILFTYELARRLEGSATTTNFLHPGFVNTNFGNNNRTTIRLGLAAAKLAGGISVKKGARTSVYLAAAPEVNGLSGKYFEQCSAKDSSPQSYSTADQKRLWTFSQEILGAI